MGGYPSQMVYLPMVGSLDTKSDEKTVLAPNLVRLENADFTEGGSVRARAGYRAVPLEDQDGNAIAGPVGLGALGPGWVLFTRRSAYQYDNKRVRWSEMGAYAPVTHVLSDVAPTAAKQSLPAMATSSGVTAVAWEDSRGGVRCSVFNDETGAIYVSEYVLAASSARQPKVVAAGTSLLITWFDTANNAIVAKVVRSADPRTSVQAATVTLAADANATGAYDIIAGTDVAYLLFRQDAAVVDAMVVKVVNSFGTVTLTGTDATTNGSAPQLAYDAAGNVLWAVFLSGSTIHIRSFDGDTLVVDVSTTQAGTTGKLAVGPNELGGVSIWQDTIDGSHTGNDLVTAYRRDADGAAVSNTTIRHAKVATSGWYDGFAGYAIVWYETKDATNLQSTYFVYRDDGVVVGRILYGSADSMTGSGYHNVARVSQIEGDMWQCPLTYRRKVAVDADALTGVGLKLAPVFEHQQIKRCLLDMAPQVQSAEIDGVLYASGSMLWAIDGQGPPVESSPLLIPDMTSDEPADTYSGFTDGGAGNLTASSQYNYRFFWEGSYGRGRRVRSAAVEVKYITPGSAQQVDITVPSLSHTRFHARSGMALVAYRSEGNKADLNYRVTDADPTVTGDNGYLANNPSANTLTFTDNLADGQSFVSREIDYVSKSESLHFAPDGPSLVVAAQNRLFVAGGGESPGAVQYSLTALDSGALEFTDVNLLSEMPRYGGPIKALARIDDTPVVLMERAICFLDGTGFTTTGQGEQYRPVLASTDVGCSNQRVVVEWDQGLLFLSTKGVYSLGQDFTVQYIGAAVEDFNGQEFTGATLVPDTNIVLFLTAGATERTLMYDYFYGRWGTYKNHYGLAAAATAADYAYLRADGQLYIRTPGEHVDPGGNYITGLLRIGTPDLGGLEQAWLLRSFQVLGDYLSSHSIKVGVFYDGDQFPLQESTWAPDSVLNTNFWGDMDFWGDFSVWFGDSAYSDYHFERRFKRSRARTVQFEFTWTPLAAPGTACEITEIALEVALLPGPKRLARSRKV